MKYGLAFVGGVALVSVVLSWPTFGGYLLVALVPTLSGLEPGIPVPNVRISEALIGVVGLTVIVATRRLAALRWGLLEWLLLAYGVVGRAGRLRQLRARAAPDPVAVGHADQQPQFFLLYRAVRVTLRTDHQRKMGVVVLFVSAIPMTLLAICRRPTWGACAPRCGPSPVASPPSRPARSSGPPGSSPTGPLWPGFLFPMLILLTVPALGGQLKGHRRAAVALTALLLVGLLFDRRAVRLHCPGHGRLRPRLGLPALRAHPGLDRPGRRHLRGGRRPRARAAPDRAIRRAGRLVEGVPAPDGELPRAGLYQQYLPAIAKCPLTGYGEQLPASISWPYPESQYIAILIEGGWPMLIMYRSSGGCFDRARRAARSPDPFDQALGRSLAVSTLSLLSAGIIWPFLSNGEFPEVLWCLFALAEPARSRARGLAARPGGEP